jgi:hypothetical protein
MHCPECGFVNVEGANYCQKCGAFLADVTQAHEHDDTTAAWQLGETGDLKALDPEEVGAADATLVIRAGGGRAGETFLVSGDQMNGTYVNRRRIESHKLQDGDELQVGKYKLTFLG